MSSPSVQTAGAVSERADPTALSFLSLPGEIRNNVYGYLLTRENPLLLICSEQGRGSPAPSDVLAAGTNILATSRQVHAEAIGIFYLRNQFLLYTEMLEYPMSVTNWIANWLDSLGNLAKFIETLLIQPGSPAFSIWQELDVLPLLQYLWKPDQPKFTISYDKRFHSFCGDIDVKGFSQLLDHLVTDSTLRLKEYARHPRLLESVRISPSSLSGQVVFHGPSCGYHFGPEFHFVANEYGLRPQPKPLACLQVVMLNFWIRELLLEHIVTNHGRINLNFTARTTRAMLLPLLEVNRKLRQISLDFIVLKEIKELDAEI
jgi:hypothetical protein